MNTAKNEIEKLLHLKVIDINNNMKSLLKEMDNIERKILQIKPFFNFEGEPIEKSFFDMYIKEN